MHLFLGFRKSPATKEKDKVLVRDLATNLLANSPISDPLIRFVIRQLLRKRLCQERHVDCAKESEARERFIQNMHEGPIAKLTDQANEQHYEVPAHFYEKVLGPRKKYSACFFQSSSATLSDAEEAMLQMYVSRAQIEDGMSILELGCGWGSLSLWLAEHFPKCRITAVSNSHSQRLYIERCKGERDLDNLQVITEDMNTFHAQGTFDRIVSVEMFEHMRNWRALLQKTSDWLEESGKLFIHIFCHRSLAYLFEPRSSLDWMARHFFSGGMMPSADLILHFQNHLILENVWWVNGRHYQKTAACWRQNLMLHKEALIPVLGEIYDPSNAHLFFLRWKLFFLACEELFGFNQGNEWFIAHYLFCKRRF